MGKAVNLKSRVGSYFRENAPLTLAKKNMVRQIRDIEIILCTTEVEALVLETNLIKHLSPKYNILMKDDKNLAYIKITNSPVPEIIQTRQKINDGARYFGPFTQGSNIYGSLKSLRRMFRVRSCRMKFEKRNEKIFITDKAGRSIPCMDYYIGICPAPCILQEKNINNHQKNIENFLEFLQGKSHEIIEKLKMQMMDLAKKHEYEKAQKIKEEITAIQTLSERQIARDAIDGDADIAIIIEKYGQAYIVLTKIRDGKIIGVFHWNTEMKEEDLNTIFAQFLAREYIGENADFPKMLLTDRKIDDPALAQFFREKNIDIQLPQIGKKREILDFTRNQLREYAYKKQLQNLEQKVLSRATMVNILEKLHYPIPKK